MNIPEIFREKLREVLFDIFNPPVEPRLTPHDLVRNAMRRRKPVKPATKDRSTIKAARKQKRRNP